MITMLELLCGAKLEDQSKQIQDNLNKLLVKMNQVRTLYGFPMKVTSGLRDLKKHLDIYAKKGITDQSLIPMKSKHLFGLACDIYDPDGKLNRWCKDNSKVLEELGIFLEERQGDWQHFQIEKFASYKKGNIWFNP